MDKSSSIRLLGWDGSTIQLLIGLINSRHTSFAERRGVYNYAVCVYTVDCSER